MQDKLLGMMRHSINSIVGNGKIGVAFSGGVDSTLVSQVCSEMNYDVTLLTVGFTGSHDVMFAKKVNDLLQLPHHTLEINTTTFPDVVKKVGNTINTQNLSWNENCIAFYYISQLATRLDIDMVVTANGIDELFCGYDRYRDIFSGGSKAILEAMREKLNNETSMMKAVNIVTSEFGVRIVQPLLAQDFIEYAITIPISEKIHGPDDMVRKHIIRELACRVGVPEMSYNKRKKALQYGSKIHKELLKLR